MLLHLLIAGGGALGSVARCWLSGLIATQVGETFPWGTFWVNVSGCIVIGFFATLTGPDGHWFVRSETRQFSMTGLCGGFTTFSSFSLQTLNLAHEGDWPRAAAYVVASVVVCLLGVWRGHIGAAFLNQPHGN
jgi:fluoride exporter